MEVNGLLLFILSAYFLAISFELDVVPAGADLEAEWDAMKSFSRPSKESESHGTLPRYKVGYEDPPPPENFKPMKLPESVRIPASQLYKDVFAPELGTRPVSPLLRAILLPNTPTAKPVYIPEEPKRVEVLCHLDRMYVRVQKDLFKDRNAYKKLKLGTCYVNQETSSHYYFLYTLAECEMTREENEDRVIYSNELKYRTVVSNIVRQMPFSMTINCVYTKFRRSYHTGFLTKVADDLFHRDLEGFGAYSITPVDAYWNLLAAGQSFSLGEPVCFEAKAPRSSGNNRLYLSRCFVSASPSFPHMETHTVVQNSGCLVDSENSTVTKFYPGPDKMTVRLCIEAFLFRSMLSMSEDSKNLHLHCELDVGPDYPSSKSKSCTYEAHSKRWTELYGHDSVCECCDSICPGRPTPMVETISTKAWELTVEDDVSEVPEADNLKSVWPDSTLAEHGDFELFWESNDYDEDDFY